MCFESPRAWPYGPVFPMTRKHVDFHSFPPSVDADIFSEINQDDQLIKWANHVVDKYEHYSASQLSNWSHKDGGPWDKVVNQEKCPWDTIIPDVTIKEYFSCFNV